MVSPTTDLSWLCIVIPICIFGIVAVLGTRSRLKYSKRILDAQARGAFSDFNLPEVKSRLRRLTVVALIGTFGSIVLMFFIVWQQVSGTLFWVSVTVTFILGIIGVGAGFLRKREIDRRL